MPDKHILRFICFRPHHAKQSPVIRREVLPTINAPFLRNQFSPFVREPNCEIIIGAFSSLERSLGSPRILFFVGSEKQSDPTTL